MFGFCLAAQLLSATCLSAASTDLFDAVRTGDVEKVQALLKADRKLAEARTEDGSTALHVAALEGHSAIAKLLLADGAQVNARGLRDETPLHMAMYDGHREMAELLLASKAEVDAPNAAGETPLHIAARKAHRELVELLVEQHADINAKDRQGATPLHLAAAAGHKEIVELLLSQNADPGIRDSAGRTPKAAATEKQHWEVVELLTPRVGALHDARRVMFEGAKAFTPDALRDGLRATREFFEISHPLASLESYLEAIQQKMLIGYQHHGFADARIEARHDAKAGRIVVKIEEGARYVCGEVKVTGAQKVPAEAIIERLTTCRRPAQRAPRAFVFADRAPASTPLTETLADTLDEEEPFWVKGKPAPFSSRDLREAKDDVTDLLRARGLLSPKVEARMVPNPAARTAELQVDVLAEGPRAVVGPIDVVGNRTNSTEAVLRYVGMKPGMDLTGALLASVEDRLWRSARFLTYKLNVGTADAQGQVPLQIALAEYDKAPPLNQEFSRAQQVQLKLREWLSKLDATGEDFIFRVSGIPAPAPGIEIVLSPRSGFLLCTKEAAPQRTGRNEYVMALKAGEAGLYSLLGGRKLLLRDLEAQVRVFLKIEPKPADTNEGPFNLTLGAGLNHAGKPKAAQAPYQFDMTLPPVVCIGLVPGSNCASWFDGNLLIQSNATRVLRLDAGTGQIVDFRAVPEKGQGVIEVRFEAGAYDRAVQRVEAATASLPDAANANAPLSSAVAFLIEEICSSKYLSAAGGSNVVSDAASRVPALLRYFKLQEILSPFDRLVPKADASAAGQEDFTIRDELARGEATTDDAVALITGWVLRNCDELFSARTWPWTLLHEGGLVLQHKGRYTDQALTGIYESDDTGPIGYLAASKLLAGMQPPLARKFAARGLERLSAADFRRDWSLLLGGDAIVSECCQRLAVALRNLTDEQAAALVKLQSPAWGEFVLDCRRRLQAGGDAPLTNTLAPALEAYWERTLKGQVAAALKAQSFDPANAFNEGLSAYRSPVTRDEAAKLFTQAAAHGHPGAQYYLGMMYEQGSGVTKNIEKALQYYYQAATNGYSEAAVVLGNYYSEGLVVPQSQVEAYVWYSLAAARGDRMSDVFRAGAKSRLTASQLATAQRRVADILAKLPDAEQSQSGTDQRR